MTTTHRDISAALDSKTNTLGYSVAWENAEFTPTTGTLYLRTFLLPGETIQAALGDNGIDEHVGVYQIDINTPGGAGKGAAISASDTIADAFARGTTLLYNGVEVRIMSVSRGPALNRDGWYVIPLSINYMAHVAPR